MTVPWKDTQPPLHSVLDLNKKKCQRNNLKGTTHKGIERRAPHFTPDEIDEILSKIKPPTQIKSHYLGQNRRNRPE